MRHDEWWGDGDGDGDGVTRRHQKPPRTASLSTVGG